jgi:hypothetical protein
MKEREVLLVKVEGRDESFLYGLQSQRCDSPTGSTLIRDGLARRLSLARADQQK